MVEFAVKCPHCYRGSVWEEGSTRTVQKVCPACKGSYKNPRQARPMSAGEAIIFCFGILAIVVVVLVTLVGVVGTIFSR